MVFVKNDAVNVWLKSKTSALYIEKRTYEDKSLSTQVRSILRLKRFERLLRLITLIIKEFSKSFSQSYKRIIHF